MKLLSRSSPLRDFLQSFIAFSLATSYIALAGADDQRPVGVAPAAITPKRVAVIGAGSGGSSSAYYLRKFADISEIPVNITVFERASHVGGRSTTVNVFGNPAYPVELGASIFVQVNKNLVNAAKEFGLNVNGASQDRPGESEDSLGVWDGERFVYKLSGSMDWWNVVKMLWKYGWAPVRTQNLMKNTVNKFLQLYESPMFPFESLTSAAYEAGLLGATSSTGAEFLNRNSISPDFSRDIIQASTRVNYGQNLRLLHGLETMVCMATDGAVSVQGGNWQIFDGMLRSSGADVRLNTTVTSIQRNEDGRFTVSSRLSASETKQSLFDEVVIAGPLQYSDIKISPPLDHNPEKIPYVTLHVTLFSSPHRISPKYFNLEGTTAPETILTTLPRGVDLGAQPKGVGPTGFWSISTLRHVKPPVNYTDDAGTPEKHYVYKIFSPERLTADFVADILDIDKPKGEGNLTIGDMGRKDVSWFHEKTWNSYPYLYPRVTFEEISLGPNIWYTSGIENFISTMETSSLMGKNVAALITKTWLEELGLDRGMPWNSSRQVEL
ncbi:hypothetical protein VTN00DRAFT_1664 [Thermoascus crustaceus]|uniref:uncharacterized protein n=1 Tax=Thermoascus crustaceus TaxID=5088 RepID=UPI0037428523